MNRNLTAYRLRSTNYYLSLIIVIQAGNVYMICKRRFLHGWTTDVRRLFLCSGGGEVREQRDAERS